MGFGLTETGKTGEKRYANVPIASHDCSGRVGDGRTDAQGFGCIEGGELVAAGTQTMEADTCKGDSGGPAFVTLPDHAAPETIFDAAMETTHAIAGVTSRSASKIICGDGGIYVRIGPDIEAWIAGQSNIWQAAISSGAEKPR